MRHWRPPDRLLRRRGLPEYLTHLPFTYLSLALGDQDVAHALYATDGLAAARWSRRVGRPAVLSHIGLPHRAGLSYQRLRLEITLKAMRECTAVTVLSEAAAEALWRWLGLRARVIHPGVDLRRFTPDGERAEAPTFFCGAAMDDPRKRVGLLVSAFQIVRRERPDARLVLSRPRDHRFAARVLAAGPAIELRSFEDSATLCHAYRNAWVSVLPSYGEAFGLTLLEALACGRPVVASNEGALPEVVDREEIGRLFDGSDERALAAALLDALELAEDASTAAACRSRAEDFSIERTSEQYERLYLDLLSR